MKRNPKDMERALRTLAVGQGGYFTAAQALAIGYTYPQQHFHRQRGNWEAVDRGIFRFPDFPGWPHEDLIRWALWSCDRRGTIQAVVSHETALSVYDISDVMPAKVHLTVPPAFRKQPPGGCIMHRAILDQKDFVRRDGFLITTPLKTILDIAESDLSGEHLEGAIRDALREGLVHRWDLVRPVEPPHVRERLLIALAKLGERVA